VGGEERKLNEEQIFIHPPCAPSSSPNPQPQPHTAMGREKPDVRQGLVRRVVTVVTSREVCVDGQVGVGLAKFLELQIAFNRQHFPLRHAGVASKDFLPGLARLGLTQHHVHLACLPAPQLRHSSLATMCFNVPQALRGAFDCRCKRAVPEHALMPASLSSVPPSLPSHPLLRTETDADAVWLNVDCDRRRLLITGGLFVRRGGGALCRRPSEEGREGHVYVYIMVGLRVEGVGETEEEEGGGGREGEEGRDGEREERGREARTE
jgi:hypothetical protein